MYACTSYFMSNGCVLEAAIHVSTNHLNSIDLNNTVQTDLNHIATNTNARMACGK